MVDKGLSRFIPGEVHEAHRPVAAGAWELAALLYVVAVWLSVIGSLVLGFSISFHAGLGGFFLGGPSLFAGAAVSVVALTLVARASRAPNERVGPTDARCRPDSFPSPGIVVCRYRDHWFFCCIYRYRFWRTGR